MEHIATSELPETLQQIFTEIQSTKTPLTVTHEEESLVIIYPATPQTFESRILMDYKMTQILTPCHP
ncbi:hypothetical protein [Nostoc sp.]|uniref:hypothetical protein n=1 Tax=Nostoc sp. TaxID=1180 RepID=UPI002FFACBCD